MSDESLAAPAIVTALGLQLRSRRDPSDGLVDHIGERRLLLLIDNCEHLIEACARVIAQLESTCPNAVILATSREPLHIAGELVWRVPSLSLPDQDRPSSSEAVRLFYQRAAEASDEDLSAVVDLLRLDGMPLAIELAAQGRHPLAAADRGAPRRQPGPPAHGQPRVVHAPADATGHAGLEPRPAHAKQANPLAAAVGVRRHVRHRCRGMCRRRARDRAGRGRRPARPPR